MTPLRGGRRSRTPPWAPAYVARAPASGRLRLSADGGSVDGPFLGLKPQVLHFRCVPAPMRSRFLLAAGLLVAALITGIFTTQRSDGLRSARGASAESAAEV